ncbi:hypothetical protein [Flavobacterium sp. NRK1]|uniref:hypothetical protein n=1 Tax=Flavobacterium sp. NRK1 TaxID=2954929 RepID=UPI0020927467|nr:hypothetical protein [Flavobacterium sp. NRK1]
MNRQISVEIDPLLLPDLNTLDKVTTSRTISINLYKLIYSIGAIQTRRFAPSNRMKFLDKADLVEKIYSNTNEFRIKIAEIRQATGSETLKTISEDFGVGISVAISEKLFNIKTSTIQRIYGNTKRPDWKCQMVDDRVLVVESKGAISIQTSNRQQANAIAQKNRETGDIKVASLTILNEDRISASRFIDPPISNGETSPIMENHILRAGHYASVFSFLGNSRLSKYYSQMRKRLEGSITLTEQNLKNRDFKDLLFNGPIVNYANKNFVGSFYKIGGQKFLFVGIDRELLSYEGFLNFREYEEDLDMENSNSHYILYKDGVLIIEINDIEQYSDIVDIQTINNYQDKITISDIDEMNELSFSKFFKYILEKNHFTEITDVSLRNDTGVDLSAKYNDIKCFFEFKILKRKKISLLESKFLNNHNYENSKLIFITNAIVNNNDLARNLNIIIIDRNKLEYLIKNKTSLQEILDLQKNN